MSKPDRGFECANDVRLTLHSYRLGVGRNRESNRGPGGPYNNYNNEPQTARMPSSALNFGLKRRSLAFMGGLAAGVSVVFAVLLYLLATGRISLLTFGVLLFAGVLVGTGIALLLIQSLADGFARPLREVSIALANAARGDFDSVANFGE